MKLLGSLVLGGAGLAFGHWAAAQDAAASFPSKPVTIIVASAPGGAGELEARLYAQKLNESLKQPFIIEFKAGAGGAIGAAYVAKAAPDGYTLLVVSGNFVVAPITQKNLSYDPIRNFAPVMQTSRLPSLLVVSTNFGPKNIQEYIAYARANPGKINFGTPGNGSMPHLSGAALHSMTNTTATFVPYKGMGDAISNLVDGQIQAGFISVLAALPLVKSGKLRSLGINTAQREKSIPDVPTIAEQGVPGYDTINWTGYVTTAGTPAAVVQKLNAGFARATGDPEVSRKLDAAGLLTTSSTPEEFRRFLISERDRWAKVAKDINFVAD